MRKFITAFIITFSIAGAYAVSDGSQWLYSGYSPAGAGAGYTGGASLNYAGDVFFNPANPANVRRFRIFGQFGINTPNYLGNLGIAVPLPAGVLTAGFRTLYFEPPSVTGVADFHFGYSRMMSDTFAFGFKVYGINQTVSNISDFGLGLDVGVIFRSALKRTRPAFLELRNHRFGITLSGLGKPALAISDTPLPGIGLRLGYAVDYIHSDWLEASANIDFGGHVYPLNIFGAAGMKFTIARHFGLSAGLIFGNNGIGSATNGILNYTLGASVLFDIGNTPIEIFYSFNPYQYGSKPQSAVHFVGAEIAFGSLDNTPPVVKINVNNSQTDEVTFSPNYDSVRDDVKVALDIKDTSRIKHWEVRVMNQSGKVIKHFGENIDSARGISPKGFWKKIWEEDTPLDIPKQVEWKGEDDKGSIQSDGVYYIYARAIDALDNEAFSATNKVTLDATSPNAEVTVKEPLFSPNDDGRKDDIYIDQKLSAGDSWKAQIRGDNDRIIATWDFGTNLPVRVKWDGKDKDGKVAPDGSYDYVVFGTDSAGNRAITSFEGINLTTKSDTIFLNLSANAFSPNGDSVLDTITLTPTFSDTSGLVSYSLTIQETNGTPIKVFSGSQAPEKVVWDGNNGSGKKVPDGVYECHLQASYRNGNQPKTKVHTIILDTTPPEVQFAVKPLLFSPDGDGEDDLALIYLKLSDLSDVAKWEVSLISDEGVRFKRFSGSGKGIKKAFWNGYSDLGEPIESAASYSIELAFIDIVSNQTLLKASKPIETDILVEKTSRGKKIRIKDILFDKSTHHLAGDAFIILDRLTFMLKKFPTYTIDIHGHSGLAYEKDDYRLARKRAEAVKAYLLSRGIHGSRMKTEGNGSEYPVGQDVDMKNEHLNQRVDFILHKK